MNKEQLIQEARIEAEKVYPYVLNGNEPVNYENILHDAKQRHRIEGYVECYIANAKKSIAEIDEFKRRCVSELHQAGFYQAMMIVQDLI